MPAGLRLARRPRVGFGGASRSSASQCSKCHDRQTPVHRKAWDGQAEGSQAPGVRVNVCRPPKPSDVQELLELGFWKALNNALEHAKNEWFRLESQRPPVS